MSESETLAPPGVLPPGRKTPRIFWEGTQFAWHSFARVNREMCSNIILSGAADLTTVPYEPDQFSPAGAPMLESLSAHDIRHRARALRVRQLRPDVWVRHQWPPREQPPGRAKWVIVQPWEYSLIPSEFVRIFRSADEIWTPSNFSARAFVASGVERDRVAVVPNGVDTGVFTPAGADYPLPTARRVRFLFVGGAIHRKGIDVLLAGYGRAFAAGDDVTLVVKETSGPGPYAGQTAAPLIERFRGLPRAPEVIQIERHLDDAELAGLYRACDVFVSPYRGEGFSLPALEAMSCGLPAIVTGGGATDDFVDESVGWRVGSKPRSVGHEVYGLELPGEGFLLEADAGHLAELMALAAASPGEVNRRGREAAARARRGFTWRHAAVRALSRVDALCGTCAAPRAAAALLGAALS